MSYIKGQTKGLDRVIFFLGEAASGFRVWDFRVLGFRVSGF